MRPRYFQYFFLAAAIFAHPGYSATPPLKKPLPLHTAIQDKNFYLLSLLQASSEAHRSLTADKELTQIKAGQEQRLRVALRRCKESRDCTLNALIWTDEEIHSASQALARIYQKDPHFKKIVDERLQASGAYMLYQQQSGQDLLVSAWELCAHGMNEVLSVYGDGTHPRYPQIDSISFDVHSADFQERIAELAEQVSDGTSASALFFEPSLKAALQLLAFNHRDEAGRFEPMEETVNKAALRSIPSINWNNYAYSVIVVPGAGPNDPTVALSEAGRKRTALAAQAYHAGRAPFILVSGGYVHPSQTQFAEAIEMEKALLRDYQVPEEAILVDPHARHTTTNMRNAAREIYRYNIPMNKQALVISDSAQITYIQGQFFADRCREELGYVPYQIIERPSDTSLVFLPRIEALQQNPLDPLDP
jgi:hypothetical protein